MKRILAVLLCVALIFGSVFSARAEQAAETEPTENAESTVETQPGTTADAEETEEKTGTPVKPEKPKFVKRPGMTDTDVKMEELAWDIFTDCQVSSRRYSFHGYCGNFVSHQLYNLGINRSLSTRHGKDHFDYYSALEKTTGGYFPRAISTTEVHLTGALNYITEQGARDVYNVMVGFDWTNTEAGNKYGHVVLIYAIIGGAVYFSESFDMSFKGKLYPEGSIVKCSVEDFVDYYDGWTTYEGIVVFGTTEYADNCKQENTNLTVQTRFPTVLRSEPAVVGKQGCVRLRDVAAGERLHVTAIYRAERTMYYRVETNEGFGFVSTAAVSLLQVNTQGLTLSGLKMSRQIDPGKLPTLDGHIADSRGDLSSIEVCITDEQGQLVRRELLDVAESDASLSVLRSGLWFDLLEQGQYRVEIYASRACSVVVGGEILSDYARVLLTSRSLQVGGHPREAVQMTAPEKPYRDGWFREQGTWYCYADGKPCTGWTEHMGIRYYLQPNGAVTTGAQTIDGQALYFAASGALVTGWQTLDDKTFYRSADGTAVTGWQTLDGKLYCFADDGVMLTDTEQAKEGVTYIIAKDGTAKQIEKQEIENG